MDGVLWFAAPCAAFGTVRLAEVGVVVGMGGGFLQACLFFLYPQMVRHKGSIQETGEGPHVHTVRLGGGSCRGRNVAKLQTLQREVTITSLSLRFGGV